MFGGITFAGALFGGVVGIVGPLPAVPTDPGIIIGGIDVTARVRVQGVTIRDVLNDAPNTANLTIEGAAPTVGQSVTITIGPRLLFAGAIQTIDQAYESIPTHVAWHLTAIDDTGRANMRRPFGTFVDTSASTIAQTITTTFAPGFATTGIAAGLPNVTITFDGADTFIACLARLATAVGGYCKIEDRRVFLFLVDPADTPDPIDANHRFLINPPITLNTDVSQLRTRVYGKGYGENVPTDVGANETLIPIQDGALFPQLGGTAIVGFTADGAQSDRIAFTGVSRPPGGTLVGSGAAPTTAPVLGLVAGGVVTSGVHQVAVVHVTAAGKSIASPPAALMVGVVAAPGTAPAVAPPVAGSGPDPGSHDYVMTFAIVGGETLPSPISAAITTTVGANPVTPGGVYNGSAAGTTGGNLTPGSIYTYTSTFVTANGETVPPGWTLVFLMGGADTACNVGYNPSTDPRVTQIRFYRSRNGGAYERCGTLANGPDHGDDFFFDTASDASIAGNPPPPSVNSSGAPAQQIPVSAIPIGPGGTTGRKLYRRFNAAGTFKLVTTIANNTGTTYTDSTPNSGLGAAAPTTGTAVANTLTVDKIPIGPAAVTARELYMTTAGSSALHLVQTIADNTTITATLNLADAALTGPAPPTSDTSGLTQPQGQVNPGSPTLIVASAAPFAATGGWVTTGGGQVIRYTGISGQLLTGVPASGPGAIVTTVLYGQQATPTPTLTGVTGLTKLMLKGSAVHIWVQRDDAGAQTEHAARTGTDGVVEFLIVDSRRGVPSLSARCDADLKLFSRPILTVQYATRDLKTASGKTVSINLPNQPIVATMIIQEVTITELGIAPNLPPRFTVKASTVRFSLEDTLRRLIAGGLVAAND